MKLEDRYCGAKPALMIQGCASNVGKSVLVAALCRAFLRRGFKPAPFKSQNMALNSFVTKDGLEMGRAQVTQAQACMRDPQVEMNPLLLKPSSDAKSQLIIMGEPKGNYDAWEYHRKKPELMPLVLRAFHKLEQSSDVLLVEGAGSPAEINLREGDLVNMGLAEELDLPVILVADIDKGGVFASLLGTYQLLSQSEQERIIGCVINKFRGDESLLEPGIRQFEELTGLKVLACLPYLNLSLEEEDSLSTRLKGSADKKSDAGAKKESKASSNELRVGIIRLKRLSNYTDFSPFEQYKNLDMRYISNLDELSRFDPQLIIVPGTKSTKADAEFLISEGFYGYFSEHISKGGALIGICGGLQLLGQVLEGSEDDPLKNLPSKEAFSADQDSLQASYLNLPGPCPIKTVFHADKLRSQRRLHCPHFGSWELEGYEIHQGRSFLLSNSEASEKKSPAQDGLEISLEELFPSSPGLAYVSKKHKILLSYLHGIFDNPGFLEAVCKEFFDIELIAQDDMSLKQRQEQDLEKLACLLEEKLDLDDIYDQMKCFARRRMSSKKSDFSQLALEGEVAQVAQEMQLAKLVIAAPYSQAGKTSLSLALCSALKGRSYRLAAFKAGPDYIDAGMLAQIAGHELINLDSYLMSDKVLLDQLDYAQHELNAQLCLIEGAMGAIDGQATTSKHSAAELALRIGAKLLFCIPCEAYSASAALSLKGLQSLYPQLDIIGFVITKAKSAAHAQLIANSVQTICKLPCYGYMPYEEAAVLASRHLGLSQHLSKKEQEEFFEKIQVLSRSCEAHIELESLIKDLNLDQHPQDLSAKEDLEPKSCFQPKLEVLYDKGALSKKELFQERKPILAYAKDEAFSFYYHSSMRELAKYFELKPFSPLRDASLPKDSCACYMGGGYPEEYLELLSNNYSLKDELRQRLSEGMPCYAECGAYLYLHQELVDTDNQAFEMLGIFEGRVKMQTKRSQHFGYVELEAIKDTPFFKKGTQFHAHEFHYSVLDYDLDDSKAVYYSKKSEQRRWLDGQLYMACLGSYAHLDLASKPELVRAFYHSALQYKEEKESSL